LNKEGRKRIAESFYKHAVTTKNGGDQRFFEEHEEHIKKYE